MRSLLALPFVALLACGPNRTYPDRTAYQPATTQPLSCVPNLDGQIDRAEFAATLNTAVHYLVNPVGTTRAVQLAGETTAQGKTLWNFGTDYADDQVATLEATDLSGKWYAASFPSGEFASPLDLGGTNEGVYRTADDGMYLLGYASKDAAPSSGKTLVVYTQPVLLYRFPLKAGITWVSVGEVKNATVLGLPFFGRDTYSMNVDTAGELDLPDVSFTQALRVRTNLVVQPSAGASITRKQVGWVFECFGEVARATSQNGETADDFTISTELRRLGF
jgi:hypothetical protein